MLEHGPNFLLEHDRVHHYLLGGFVAYSTHLYSVIGTFW